MLTGYTKAAILVIAFFLCAFGNGAGTGAARISYGGHSYDIYTAAYPGENIRMYWKDDAGNKMQNFMNLKRHTFEHGEELIFATNGGMYMEDSSPLGYYVENGKQVRRIITKTDGYGNFYMQPNGVFLLTAKKAVVLTTQAAVNFNEPVLYATQSGPMLVTDGVINSNFKKGSTNVQIRSGVGVNKTGNVVFAISNGRVNLYDFAALYRDSLDCSNALFLDGAISQMYLSLPALKRSDKGLDYGVMIGITKN